MTNWITNPEKKRQGVLIAGDAIIFLSFILATAAAHSFGTGDAILNSIEGLGGAEIFGLLGVQLLVLYVFNMYNIEMQEEDISFFGSRLLGVQVVVLGVAAVVVMIFEWSREVHQVLFLQVPFMVVGGTIWRALFFTVQKPTSKRLMVVGTGAAVEPVLEWLQELPLQKYRLVGSIRGDSKYGFGLSPSSDGGGVHVPNPPSSSNVAVSSLSLTDLDEKDYRSAGASPSGGEGPESTSVGIRPEKVDTVVYTSESGKQSEPNYLVNQALQLRQRGVEVCDLPSLSARLCGRIPVSSVTSSWVVRETFTDRTTSIMERVRRVLDIIGALIGLAISFPLMILIGVAIKLDSEGPVLFTQERLGLNREPFTVYKFRTMVQNAEKNTGPTWADDEDPRVTRVGDFLRRTRLDELPQLFNILRGEMSIVGFRPIRKHFADLLEEKIPFYRLRFSIKPGLTGWPQVQHDYSGSVEGQKEKFEFELFYLTNRSLLLDLYIVIKTIQVMIFRRGQ